MSLLDTNSTTEPSSTSTAKKKNSTKATFAGKSTHTDKPTTPIPKSLIALATVKSSQEVQQSIEPSIPLTTIYNTSGNLVEISIVNCKEKISQRFIKLVNVALPFHKYLNKLTIRKGGLSQEIIYEINEMLPFSNITELCLDDNYVKQGNYYIFLDELTSLKILSLCRCSINEVVCEDIIKRLEPGRPGDKLLSLSLSTNFIGNIGASKFGDLLRRNRNLLHLNLADNGITNEGAAAILEGLKEFKLNYDEILKKNKRKMAYQKKKNTAYEVILCDQEALRLRRVTRVTSSISPSLRKLKSETLVKKGSKTVTSHKSLSSIYDLAYAKARQVVGDFKDVFDGKNTVVKNNEMYCIGNIHLCYLNLAYNSLDDRILKMILEVLTYQATLSKPSVYTGLLKLVIEGNLFSTNNVDLLTIELLLTKIMPDRSQSSNVRKVGSKYVSGLGLQDIHAVKGLKHKF